MESILFVDGRNFINKIEVVLRENKIKSIDYSLYNFGGLMDKVLTGIRVDRRLFYFGKLVKHSETLEKSAKLIENQRKLKTSLEKQGFEIVIAGRIRGHLEKCQKGHEMLVFKEKGVDVKLAVDMVTLACNNKLKTAIVGSSDSDLQPAISELKTHGVERIYLGFETAPNKGLTFTTNRTILIRNSEVLEFLPKTLFSKDS
ncbi:MAG: NYN domain-containing protein [Candidatus Nealsonbacteria bacterium DGGOD1a]|jgi:Uncharacterized conserved protein|nr:MAG: NYN domain-containing protein [Candidatus Nealsonbacteria bacterium DGGOD1a]